MNIFQGLVLSKDFFLTIKILSRFKSRGGYHMFLPKVEVKGMARLSDFTVCGAVKMGVSYIRKTKRLRLYA